MIELLHRSTSVFVQRPLVTRTSASETLEHQPGLCVEFKKSLLASKQATFELFRVVFPQVPVRVPRLVVVVATLRQQNIHLLSRFITVSIHEQNQRKNSQLA